LVVHQRFAQLEHAVRDLTQVAIGSKLERFRAMAADVARDLGKQLHELEIIGGDVRVDDALASKLNEVVLHAVRNSVDHGIESPDARTAAGKHAAGHVAIRCRAEGAELVVEIEDDGRGIDLERVRAGAISKRMLDEAGAARATDAELIEMLFAPGFSTAKQITDVSGRGVGLDVVRAMMRELGGSAVLTSTFGKGAKLALCVPTMRMPRMTTTSRIRVMTVSA